VFNSNFKHINIKKFYFNKDTFIKKKKKKKKKIKKKKKKNFKKKKKKKRITLEYIQTEYMLADA